MELKNIKIVKGMTKDEVNELTKEYILLEDEVYLGNVYKHNWRCKCGDYIKNKRTWKDIKGDGLYLCLKCIRSKKIERYKKEVEKDDEYEYMKSYFRDDTLPNGRVVGFNTYMQVKHKYCDSVYDVLVNNFINQGNRCPNCCHKYENSFAYHIEQELKLDINDVWDFKKNTINPYHISKGVNKKVWIKCQEKDYHGSYEVRCMDFIKGKRCSYCSSKRIHPLDSFGYHNFDKVMSWHPDNDISPFRVSRASGKRYKFICETCGYVWNTSPHSLSKTRWCPNCASSKGEKKIKGYLDKNNIKYIHDEPYFKDLLSDLGNPLRPDFILPEYKIWIEYDGEFHFKKIFKGDKHNELKVYDMRKDEYAKQNGWKMIRIPYTEFDNIEEVLGKVLKL